MKQDLRYTHGDIFETFPFPTGVLENNHDVLSKLGQQFFEKRRDYMTAHNKGMTKFYNDFHDAKTDDEELKNLRELQSRINEEVLTAYEIVGLQLQYGFHQVAYLPEGRNTRLTLSEGAREELLYRLAILNKSRSEGQASSNSNARSPGLRKPSKSDSSTTNDLFAIGGGKT